MSVAGELDVILKVLFSALVKNNGFDSIAFPQMAPLDNSNLEPPSPARSNNQQRNKVRFGALLINTPMLKLERI